MGGDCFHMYVVFEFSLIFCSFTNVRQNDYEVRIFSEGFFQVCYSSCCQCCCILQDMNESGELDKLLAEFKV